MTAIWPAMNRVNQKWPPSPLLPGMTSDDLCRYKEYFLTVGGEGRLHSMDMRYFNVISQLFIVGCVSVAVTSSATSSAASSAASERVRQMQPERLANIFVGIVFLLSIMALNSYFYTLLNFSPTPKYRRSLQHSSSASASASAFASASTCQQLLVRILTAIERSDGI